MKFFLMIYYLMNKDLSPLMTYINFSSMLIMISLVGAIWNKSNFLMLLLTVEMLFFSLLLNYVYMSVFTKSILGQIFALFMVTVAASETAMGLSLLVIAYSLGSKVSYDSLLMLRG